MFYYLGSHFTEWFSALNVLTYITVRAGGAAFTGFIISLIIGPWIIRWLRALKIGQFIRKDHVQDLHELHKGKSGTPTMGGVLIIVSTVLSLLLWGRFDNRILIVATLVLVVLGAVGFIDDYIKLRRKHNQGLSARAKFTGQIIVGITLGAYLFTNPITAGRTRLTGDDVADWDKLRVAVEQAISTLEPDDRPLFAQDVYEGGLENASREQVVNAMNLVLMDARLYPLLAVPEERLSEEGRQLLAKSRGEKLGARDAQRLNILAFEAKHPEAVHMVDGDLHTKLEIPMLKDIFIPLGVFYIIFVLLVVVGSSNAVNLTDGLDGLAIGASVISLIAFTLIAYIISRADWSRYLFLVYVPEATELTVFGGALIGTGLGFLWFNSHPAEVFMGDTGSLALGGAIGAMAILTKQELLLVIVGGLFVLEAVSVILQVGSFKLRGKRIFRMAPLHHHFELRGWSESKVTIRFWIIAILFAMMSLSALKLR